MKLPTLGKRKPNFVIGSIITKVNIELSKRVIGKFLRNDFALTIALMATVALKSGFLIFEQYETHVESKERETFWQDRLKAF